MDKKVFVVWRSSNEEDGILGVFSTEEKAQEFISHSPEADCDSRIEEFDLDPENHKGAKKYRLRKVVAEGYEKDFVVLGCSLVHDITPMFSTVTYTDYCHEFRVFAVSKEEAIDIARRKEEYIKENPEKYKYLGVKCNFRFGPSCGPFVIKALYTEHDLETGAIITRCAEFLGPVEE